MTGIAQHSLVGTTLITMEAGKSDTKTQMPAVVNRGARFAYWGPYNQEPTVIMNKLWRNELALPAMYRKLGTLYGDGIRYYKKSMGADGKINKEYLLIQEIEDFIEENSLTTHWLIPQMVDYRIMANCFGEFIYNRAKTKVVRLNHLCNEFTRLTPVNPKSLKHEFLAYSAYFLLGGEPSEDVCTLMPILDMENVNLSLSKVSGYKVGYHNYLYSSGRINYAKPPWQGIYRDGGWLDVSNQIPEIIEAIHRNQMVIKYHVKIPATYWSFWYKDYVNLDDKAKQELQKTKKEEFDKFLTNTENAGKTFLSTYGIDPITGNAIPGFEIQAIEDKVRKDEYIPNSQEASSKILYALGLDPSLVGLQTHSNSMGAGSGSDKREANNQQVLLSKVDQEIILRPLNILSRINGWGVTFELAQVFTTTLNQDPSGIAGGAANNQNNG
jgi:hypothetical protein